MDHYASALLTTNQNIFRNKWIVPYENGERIPLCAYGLLKYVVAFNKQRVFELRPNTNVLGQNFVLARGPLLSDKNDDGMILLLTKGKTAVLPGDCDPQYWPPAIGPQIFDYLLAPHHGAKMSSSQLVGKPGSLAVILSGHNSSGHPNWATRRFLRSRHFEVVRLLCFRQKRDFHF